MKDNTPAVDTGLMSEDMLGPNLRALIEYEAFDELFPDDEKKKKEKEEKCR